MENIKLLCVNLMTIALFFGCGGTTADFLAKYDQFGTVFPFGTVSPYNDTNGAGVFIDDMSYPFNNSILIRGGYQNININRSEDNLKVLSGRFYIADARYPEKELPVVIGTSNVSKTEYASDGSVKSIKNYPVTTLFCTEKIKKPTLLIVGFKGIDSTEAFGLATPPLFFLISLDEEKPTLFSEHPRLADDLFDATHSTEKVALITIPFSYHLSVYDIYIHNVGKEENGKTHVEFFYDCKPLLKDEISQKTWYDALYSDLQEKRLFKIPFETEILVGDKIMKQENRFYYARGYFKMIYNTTEEPDTIYLIRNNQKITFPMNIK